MSLLFISDLHLSEERPQISDLFHWFLTSEALTAQALYILGDLFDVWIGDDDDSALAVHVAAALKRLVDQGVTVYLMHGNRDFLIGTSFAARCGAQLIPDPTVIDLYGTKTVLLHGDTLCTDDIAYQAFRVTVRSPDWQRQILEKPPAERRQLAQMLRAESQQAMKDKVPDILDVNAEAVTAVLHRYGVSQMIHGHTHRPAIHQWVLDAQPVCRIVLGDWIRHGWVLRCNETDCLLQPLPIA